VRMTPAEVRSRLAGDPTFDAWNETKRQWFCGRVVDIQSALESMKGPNYSVRLKKLKSSLTKTLAALEPLGIEVIDYLAAGLPPPNMSRIKYLFEGLPAPSMDRAMADLAAFKNIAQRLLAMPKPDDLIELTTDPNEEPECGYSGGDGPGGRRKWRNDVVTAMVHELIEGAGIAITRTGKSIYSEGSPSMKLMASVFDCLDPKKGRRKTDTVLKRVVRARGKKTPRK
jgi:hypothetical protein